MAVSFFRLLQTVTLNPGYVPRAKDRERTSERIAEHDRGQEVNDLRTFQDAGEKDASFKPIGQHPTVNGGQSLRRFEEQVSSKPSRWKRSGPSLEEFHSKDVFVCENDGRPPYCSHCEVYKPDRTHHCSEVDRCVRKMDHFCPW